MPRISIKKITYYGFSLLIIGALISSVSLITLLLRYESIIKEQEVIDDAHDSIYALQYSTEKLLTTHNLNVQRQQWQSSIEILKRKLQLLEEAEPDNSKEIIKLWRVIYNESSSIAEQLEHPLFGERNIMEKSLLRRFGEGFNANETSEYYVRVRTLVNSIDYLQQYEAFLVDEIDTLNRQRSATSASQLEHTKKLLVLLPLIAFIALATLAVIILILAQKAEDTLHESQKSLSEAQRIAKIGNWTLDHVTNNLTWSNELYRIFELEAEMPSPSYEAYLDLIHPDDRSFVTQAHANSLKSKRPFDLVYRLKLADDLIKYVHTHSETTYGKNGMALSTSATMQDITKQKENEELLRRTEKMDALGKLTGGIAHDFNNVLGIIIGYTELLDGQLKSNDKLSGYINQILKASHRAKKLTNNLLSFSRKEPITLEQININTLLLDEMLMLEKTLTAKITLNLELDDELWPVSLDSAMLEDAILNMSINAMHAMPGGGALTFTTRNMHLEQVDIQSGDLHPGDYVLLSVTDTGAGMDQETQKKIFDPFFTTKGEHGTGLGMSQVYGFMRQSGGAIHLHSKPGHGTRFSLYFPRHNASQTIASDTIYDAQSLFSTGDETILVVDDEIPLLDLLDNILTLHGYRVLRANNARQALEILQEHTVDILLTDAIMPGINGYQLAEEVERVYPTVKIQIASGFTDERDLNNKSRRYYQQRLQKPLNSEILLQRVRELLDKDSAND